MPLYCLSDWLQMPEELLYHPEVMELREAIKGLQADFVDTHKALDAAQTEVKCVHAASGWCDLKLGVCGWTMGHSLQPVLLAWVAAQHSILAGACAVPQFWQPLGALALHPALLCSGAH